MKNIYSKCFSEIYRLLPVIGILLLALLGTWWGSRTSGAVHSVRPPDSRTSPHQSPEAELGRLADYF